MELPSAPGVRPTPFQMMRIYVLHHKTGGLSLSSSRGDQHSDAQRAARQVDRVAGSLVRRAPSSSRGWRGLAAAQLRFRERCSHERSTPRLRSRGRHEADPQHCSDRPLCPNARVTFPHAAPSKRCFYGYVLPDLARRRLRVIFVAPRVPSIAPASDAMITTSPRGTPTRSAVSRASPRFSSLGLAATITGINTAP